LPKTNLKMLTIKLYILIYLKLQIC